MIDFTRAFDSAWQRTQVILLRPFDPAKWFVIGFNAFLALLAEGGVAINNSIQLQNQNQNYKYHSLPAVLHALKAFVAEANTLLGSAWIAVYILIAIIYLVVWLAGSWVGCRGQFMFLDNIVRNRAVISTPWKQYAHQANIWFLFHLGLVFLSWLLLLGSGAAFIALNWAWIYGERDPNGVEIGSMLVFGLVFVVLWMIYAAVLFLIRSFALSLYFKQTMVLGAALGAVVKLTATQPVSVLVYIIISALLSLAGGLLAVLIICMVGCIICWLACIPFLGSMLLSFVLCQLILPILIFYRCFQLDCLAQFGPAYDVWTVDVPPTYPMAPISHQPPLG